MWKLLVAAPALRDDSNNKFLRVPEYTPLATYQIDRQRRTMKSSRYRMNWHSVYNSSCSGDRLILRAVWAFRRSQWADRRWTVSRAAKRAS